MVKSCDAVLRLVDTSSPTLFRRLVDAAKQVGKHREFIAHLQKRLQDDVNIRAQLRKHLETLTESDADLSAQLQALLESDEEIRLQLARLQLQLDESGDGSASAGIGSFVTLAGGGVATVGGVAVATPTALGAAGTAMGVTAATTTTTVTGGFLGFGGTTTTTVVVTTTGRGLAFAVGGVVGVVVGVGLTAYGAHSWYQNRRTRQMALDAENQAAQIAQDQAEIEGKLARLIEEQHQAFMQEREKQNLESQCAQMERDLAEAEKALTECVEQLRLAFGVTNQQMFIDFEFLIAAQTQLQKPGVHDFEEMLRHFHGAGILSREEVSELRELTHSKMEQWKSEGVSEEVIQSRIPIYWYTLDEPAVFKKVAELMNAKHAEKRERNLRLIQNVQGQTFVGMVFIKWLIDGTMALDQEYDFSGQAFRVMNHVFNDDEWEAKKPGNIIAWHTVRSVTTDFSVLEPFADDNFEPEKGLTIFTIQDCNGKKIAPLSEFPEEEVLLLPGTVFKVIDRQRGVPGSCEFSERADKITLQMQGNVFVSRD